MRASRPLNRVYKIAAYEISDTVARQENLRPLLFARRPAVREVTSSGNRERKVRELHGELVFAIPKHLYPGELVGGHRATRRLSNDGRCKISFSLVDSFRKRTWLRKLAKAFAVGLLIYIFVAYVVMPWVWMDYLHRHPALNHCPNITLTSDEHPGDPINVGLIGGEQDVRQILQVAGWYPADALGLRSDLKIAADTVLERSYAEAPVSNLYLFGRKEDLAFEKPVGHDPRQRHHVRFWRSTEVDDQQRPLWLGSVTYDKRVGLSRTTGQITHHIDGNIDAERDYLFEDLTKSNALMDVQFIAQFQKTLEGRNGGGDPWHTDGRLRIGTIQFNPHE